MNGAQQGGLVNNNNKSAVVHFRSSSIEITQHEFVCGSEIIYIAKSYIVEVLTRYCVRIVIKAPNSTHSCLFISNKRKTPIVFDP